MPTYKIRGIDVDFPFEAYDCQLVYMEKVIQSLQERCNALLESPTGTGKTLCLLCAALAWRKSLGGFSTGKSCWKAMETGSGHADVLLSQSRGEKIPTLVYTSRTHSQLRQVIQELKRTNYRPKMVVLGSREQLCIHDDVSKLQGKAQTNACNYVCRKRRGNRCSHYPRVAEFLKINPQLGDEPIDIEELVNIGRSCGPCPYYLSKELHKVVDIVFAPYNYLIDHHYRKSLSIEWKNSVLIFDEAHNLESLCSEAASFDLSSGLLTACISEAKNCIDLSVARREKSSDKSYDPDNFAILRALLLKLEKRIAEVPIDSKELGFTKPGPYVYEFLSDLNITDETSSKLVNIIEDAATLLEEDLTGDRGNEKTKGSICRLESMGDILQIIFKDGRKSHAIYYCFHVQETEANGADVFKGKASRTMSWWCFNPGISMETFSKMEAGSIILTSGTLSPMDSFVQELKLKFPIRLENPHVITQSQIWAGIVAAGPSGCTFNSSYRNRDSLEYKQDLGNAIVNFARIVPDGLLVFFSSYYVLDQCIGCWKNVDSANLMNSSTIWERICRYKQPVVEPRQSSLFLLSIEDYMAKLKDTSSSGAIFFAVCRGKVSEGLDFADHAGRAVVITGMPFATRTDPKVRLKREYLDQWAISEKNGIAALTGEEWYSQQASRAVNQAVGRVIRHRNDYGAIIFCDERFLQPHRQSQISLWIRPHIQCYTKFGDAVFSLTQFFRDGGTHGCTRMKLASRDAKNVEMMKSTTQDQIRMQKVFTFPSAQVDRDCSSLSSLLEHKRGDLPGKWKDVPPANWSSLTPSKPYLTLGTRCSGNLLCNEKNLLTNRKKMMRCQRHETIDLITHSSVDKAPAELPSCSGKKQKVFETHMDAIQQSSSSDEKLSGTGKPETLNLSLNYNSVKHERDLPCDGRKQDALVTQKSEAVVLSQRERSDMFSPVSSSDKEKRGSAFLIQVQEMLSAVEYKKFLDFMKALKTKALEIDQVLQSIGRLFSGPERLPLRKRFKDYIPAKYHVLYEKYF